MTATPLESILERIHDELPRSTDLLFEILRQPSISASGEGIEECARLLEGLLRDLEFDVANVAEEGPPLLLGTLDVDPRRPTILFYGHYDVQPADPVDEWTSPPFEPRIRDGRIYARGAGDNKGQFICHLLAVDAFRRAGVKLPVNVKILIDGEEEMGSPHLAASIRAGRDRLAADVVVTADGPYHENGSPLISCGVRGVLYVELRLRGAERDLHSGHFGGLAPLPAWRLIECLHSFLDADGFVDFPGFQDAVREPSDADRRAIEASPLDEGATARSIGLTSLPERPGGTADERVMFRPHFNLAGIRCGYSGPGAKTVIPSEAVAKIDVRIPPDQEPDAVLTAIREHLRARGFDDVEVVQLQSVPPSRTPVDHPVVERVGAAVERAWGRPPIIVPSMGATLPDYVFTRDLGLPSLFVPYANPDERNHAPDENLLVEAFHRGIRTSAAMMMELAELPGSPDGA